ncbi:hypothetical protein D3C72_1570380 [compost metagenome]
MKIEKIYIPEILWETEQFNPLAVVTYLSTIEKSGVSGACKTCWDLAPELGGNTCFNNSMDGILTPKGETRSVWWAYKLYAESLNKRYATKNIDDELVTLSYADENDATTLIIGNISKIQTKTLNLSFSNLLPNSLINKNKSGVLKLSEVINNGSNVLDKPKLILQKKVSVKNNSISVQLKSINPSSLYYLKISDK